MTIEQFFHRAEATGEREEAVGHLGHPALALVRGSDDVQFGQLVGGTSPR